MTESETAQIMAYAHTAWPNLKINPETPMVWHDILGDVPNELAQRAVRNLARRGQEWVNPGQIRREALALSGVLPDFDPEGAFRDAVTCAGDLGVPPSGMSALSRQTYGTMGGSPRFESPHHVVRREFREVYQKLYDEQVDAILTSGDMAYAIEQARERQAITA